MYNKTLKRFASIAMAVTLTMTNVMPSMTTTFASENQEVTSEVEQVASEAETKAQEEQKPEETEAKSEENKQETEEQKAETPSEDSQKEEASSEEKPEAAPAEESKPEEAPAETETSKPKEENKETEPETEKKWFISIPVLEDVKCSYDGERKDKALSGNGNIVLSYLSGEDVYFEFDGEIEYSIVDSGKNIYGEWKDVACDKAAVFKMPEKDLAVVITYLDEDEDKKDGEKDDTNETRAGPEEKTDAEKSFEEDYMKELAEEDGELASETSFEDQYLKELAEDGVELDTESTDSTNDVFSDIHKDIEEGTTEETSEVESELETEAVSEAESELETEAISEAETESETEDDGKHRVWVQSQTGSFVTLEGGVGEYAPGETVKFTVSADEKHEISDIIVYSAAPVADDEETESENETLSSELLVATEEQAVLLSEGDIINPSEEREFEFVMGETDSIIKTNAATKVSIHSYDAAGGSIMNLFGTSWAGSSSPGSIVYVCTFNTGKNKSKGSLGYCIIPEVMGTPTGNLQAIKLGTGGRAARMTAAEQKRITKALFYLYGGPGYDETINGINLAKIIRDSGVSMVNGTNDETYTSRLNALINAGKNGNLSFTNDEQHAYMTTHMILGYIYCKATGLSDASWDDGDMSNTARNTIKKVVEKIDSLPDPKAEFSSTSVGSTYDATTASCISETVTYTSFNKNRLTLKGKVPANTTIQIVGGSTFTAGQQAVIRPGKSFYIARTGLTAADEGTVTKYTFEATYATEFDAYVVDMSSNSSQDLGFSYVGDDELDLNVTWHYSSNVPVKVVKSTTAGYEQIVASNSNYSLAGAQFELRDGTGAAVASFVTDANGDTTEVEVDPGTYTLVETKAPSGYMTSANQSVIITGTETSTVVIPVADVPIFSNISFNILKIQEDIPDNRLPNAQFLVSFYNTAGGVNLRNWVLQSDSNGEVLFDNAHRIDGHELFTVGGSVVMPLGYVTITETKAPAGYKLNTAISPISIAQSGETAVVIGDNTTAGYVKTVPDVPIYGGLRINKTSKDNGSSPTGDATFIGAKFGIYNNDTKPLRKRGGDIKSNGDLVETIVCDNETGIVQSSLDLQAGKYIVRELEAPEGYNLPEGGFAVEVDLTNITEDGQVVEASQPFIEPEKRGGFHLEKQDLELVYGLCPDGGEDAEFWEDHTFGSNGAQGDARLAGAEFSLINRSKNPVVVDVNGDGNADKNTETFGVGAEIIKFQTNENAVFETANNFLPYGTYQIKEVKAPEGYKMKGTNNDVTISIREDLKVVDIASDANSSITDGKYVTNDPIRGDISIDKIAIVNSELYQEMGYEEAEADAIRVLENIEFTITLKSTGKEYCKIKTQLAQDAPSDGGGRIYATTKDPNYPHGRLPYGTYVVHEVEETVPEGLLPIKDFEVKITSDGADYHFYKNDVVAEEAIRLIKIDSESKKEIPVAGVTFEIYRNAQKSQGGALVELNDLAQDKKVSVFTTDANGRASLPQRLVAGRYYLHEVQGPAPYFWNEDKYFTVTTRNTLEQKIEWTFEDEPGKGIIEIEKYDSMTKDKIAGAKFRIVSVDEVKTPEGTVHYTKGQTVDEVVIDENGNGKSVELYIDQSKSSHFTVQEIEAPEGYALDETIYDVTLKYDKTMGNESMEGKDRQKYIEDGGFLAHEKVISGGEAKVPNTPTSLELLKLEKVEDGEEWDEEAKGPTLDGIEFTIERIGDPAMTRYDNGNVYTGGKHTTANGGLITADHIGSGLYSIKETATLPGYVLDDTVKYFMVTKDGYIFECDSTGAMLEGQNSKAASLSIEWKNEYTRWQFSKADVAGEEVPGAKIQILDKDGNIAKTGDGIVCEWISEEEPHIIRRLPIGDYTMHEEVAAKGFVVASDIPFTVTNSGVLGKVQMIDKKVIIRKTDVMGEEVPGAQLAVYEITDGEDGEVVATEATDSWTSTTTPHDVDNLIVGHKYRLVEEVVAPGYILAHHVDFTVTDDGADQTEVMVDKKVVMSKTDITTAKEVPGAKITVTDIEADKVVDEWVSGDTPHNIENLEIGKKYRLHEEAAPNGFVKASDIEFEVTDDGQDQKIVMVDERYAISKTDITGSEEVEGASLTVTDIETNTVVDQWISGKTPHYVSNLEVGRKYRLDEIAAPNGYVKASSIEFEVVEDGVDGFTQMVDETTKIEISKKDITNGEEIPGARLIIKDSTGTTVAEWVSETTPHYIEKLPVGTYTLTEITAPDGYEVAETITFEIKDTPEIQHVEMFDKPYRDVVISKQEITGGKEIPGAKLVVKDADGNVVEKWTSKKKPHKFKLPSGTYTLIERKPADGYTTAEEIEFTVKERAEFGDVKVKKVTMKDDVTKIKISKQDITNSKEIPGAKLQIKDKKGKVVREWVSTDKPTLIEKLPIGKYTLTEITAPNGYEIAETISFEVEDTDEIKHVIMYDKPVPAEAQGTPAPQTGDDLNVRNIVLIALAVVLLLACGGYFFLKGKKKKDAPAEADNSNSDNANTEEKNE